MTLPSALNDREQQKFIDGGPGETIVRVLPMYGMSTNTYDRIDVTYPSSVVEVYDFSLLGISQWVITITYTDSTKEFLLSAVRT